MNAPSPARRAAAERPLPKQPGPADVVLWVEFRIRAGHDAAFADAVAANARASLADEPGCHQFDVCRDPQDPGLFRLYERYVDEAAVAAHRASAHYARMQAAVDGMVERVRVDTLVRQPG